MIDRMRRTIFRESRASAINPKEKEKNKENPNLIQSRRDTVKTRSWFHKKPPEGPPCTTAFEAIDLGFAILPPGAATGSTFSKTKHGAGYLLTF